MKNLEIQTAVSEREFLYHFTKALRDADKMINRFPLIPSIKNAVLELSTSKEVSKGGGFKIVLGLEKSDKKVFSKQKKITISLKKRKSPRKSKDFVWGEIGGTLYLDFLRFIVEEVKNIVLLRRENPDISVDSFDISHSFAITKGFKGSIGLSFFDGSLDLNGEIGKSNVVTHKFTINFEMKEPVAKPDTEVTEPVAA